MELEPNIPLPRKSASLVRYPFSEMQVGDSFARPAAQRWAMSTAALRYRNLHPGWNYTTRLEGDTVRLWCIAVPKHEGTD